MRASASVSATARSRRVGPLLDVRADRRREPVARGPRGGVGDHERRVDERPDELGDVIGGGGRRSRTRPRRARGRSRPRTRSGAAAPCARRRSAGRSSSPEDVRGCAGARAVPGRGCAGPMVSAAGARRMSRGLSAVVRAAASSIASGSPSSSAQSSLTASGSSAAAETARSRNRRVAGASGPALASGSSRWTCSPRSPSGSRPVASTPTPGQRVTRPEARSATASVSRSQLSRMTSASRSRRWAQTSAHASTPGTATAPTASAIASAHELRFGDRRQIDEPGAVGPAVRGPDGRLDREPRLPHATGPDDRRHRPGRVRPDRRCRSSPRPTSDVVERTRL